MCSQLRWTFAWALALVAGVFCSNSLQAADQQAAELLPDSVLVYAELNNPDQWMDLILDHPITSRIKQLPEYQQAVADPKFREFQGIVQLMEERVGQDWRTALKTFTKGGITVAVEPGTRGVAVLVKTSDPGLLQKAHEELFALAKAHAQNEGRDFDVPETEYRGITAWKIDDGYHALFGDWLMLTNKSGLGRMIIDRYLDQGTASLADDKIYQQASQARQSGTSAWGYVRLDVVRMIGLGKKIFKDKSDNPPAELLAGGILETLKDADFATFNLQARVDQISGSIALPQSEEGMPESRQFYFAPEGQAATLAPLFPKETLLSLTGYRDLKAFWYSASDLFTDPIVAKFAEADSQMSLFFPGGEFSTELLPKLAPQMQFVLTRQTFEQDSEVPMPDVKLPAGAVIFSTTAEADLARPMKITFQKIIGLANINAGQEGRPQFDMTSYREGDATMTVAEYYPEGIQDADNPIPLLYNFSPTLVVTKNRVILSSTKALGKELAQLVGSPEKISDNVRMELNPQVGLTMLKDNREQLIAQNMLDKGHSREAAEREISLLFEIVKRFQGVSLSLVPEAGQLKLKLNLSLAN